MIVEEATKVIDFTEAELFVLGALYADYCDNAAHTVQSQITSTTEQDSDLFSGLNDPLVPRLKAVLKSKLYLDANESVCDICDIAIASVEQDDSDGSFLMKVFYKEARQTKSLSSKDDQSSALKYFTREAILSIREI